MTRPDAAVVLDLLVDLVAERVAERARADAPEPWLMLDDAAKHAGVSAKTLAGWIRDGWLASGGAGKLTRVKRSDVDDCMRRIAADEQARRSEPLSARTAQRLERLRKAG